VLDTLQLRVCEVICVSCALEVRVELLDLQRDLLGLCLFRADGGVGGGRACRGERCGEGDDKDWGLSLQNRDDDVSRRSPGAPHRASFVTRSGR
jgi:hypothetical protein